MNEFRDTSRGDAPAAEEGGGDAESGAGREERKAPAAGGGGGNDAGNGPRLVADGVIDQHGRRWVQIGIGEAVRWTSVADLAGGERGGVFRELADAGLPILTPKARTALLREVEEYKNYRPALVASRPRAGWAPPAAPGATRSATAPSSARAPPRRPR